MKTLEFIVPCYNEGEALPAFYETVSKVLSSLDGVSASLIMVKMSKSFFVGIIYADLQHSPLLIP